MEPLDHPWGNHASVIANVPAIFFSLAYLVGDQSEQWARTTPSLVFTVLLLVSAYVCVCVFVFIGTSEWPWLWALFTNRIPSLHATEAHMN